METERFDRIPIDHPCTRPVFFIVFIVKSIHYLEEETREKQDLG